MNCADGLVGCSWQNRRRLVVALLFTVVGFSHFGTANGGNPKSLAISGLLGRFYPQTGHILNSNFIGFYDSHGGVTLFGYPISEAHVENGYLVQWTERERLELHPEYHGTNSEVQLGLLGRELVGQVRVGSRESDLQPPTPASFYFPETRQLVSEPFLAYWQRNGGLSVFGYPISDLLDCGMRNADCGTEEANRQSAIRIPQSVQWFERARFEYHPELPDPYKISLGLLGLEALRLAGEGQSEIEVVNSPAPETPLQIGLSQGGESADPAFFDNVRQEGSALGEGLVRLDNIYNFYHVVSRSADGTLSYDWQRLDRVLDAIKSMGKEPMICLSYMPETMSASGDSRIHPPASYGEWAALVRATVSHLNIERKLGIRYWEVWNEPNQWNFWQGSFQDYLRVYDVTVQAALSVDPSIRIGGPAFSNFEPNGINEFMGHEANQGASGRVDFLSWHAYGQSPDQIAEQIRQARSIIAQYPQLHPELFITEFNVLPGGEGDTSANGSADKVDGAISFLASIEAMQRERLDRALLFELKDGLGAASFWGRWGVLTYDAKPKPIYYVLKAFQNRPASSRLPIKIKGGPTDGTIGVMAYGSPQKSLLFLWYKGDRPAHIRITLPGEYVGVNYGITLFDATHNDPAQTGVTTLTQLAVRNARDLVFDAKPDSLFILSSTSR